jgi:hypothetical protein
MPVPDFSPGEVLTAAAMDSIGLWKVASGSATGGAVLNIDNCFSADYRNYRIVLDDVRMTSGVVGLGLNLRVGGSNNVLNYYNIRNGWDYASGVIATVLGSNTSVWFAGCIVDGGNSSGCVIDIFQPFLTQKTGYTSQGSDTRTAGTGGLSSSGFHNSATSFTGISISVGATYANINATVYGYRI